MSALVFIFRNENRIASFKYEDFLYAYYEVEVEGIKLFVVLEGKHAPYNLSAQGLSGTDLRIFWMELSKAESLYNEKQKEIHKKRGIFDPPYSLPPVKRAQ